MNKHRVFSFFAWLAAFAVIAPSWGSPLVPDDPAILAKTTPLGRLLAAHLNHPIHIVYVHGMRADAAGASDAFRAGMCRYTKGICGGAAPAAQRSFLSLGSRPEAKYLETQVWRSDAEWQASRPFVDRYVYPRVAGQPVIVDEVNWWPLLFPPKCRFILVPESNLSGADAEHLHLCASEKAPYYPWLSDQDVKDILARKTLSGGGAVLNAAIKRQIMDWGLSDAVLVLGPLRQYFRKAMSESFEFATHFDAHSIADQEFVVISESLGSFVVLDAFQNGDSSGAKQLGERTADLYFFANQFALLELAHITVGSVTESADFSQQEQSPSDLLRSWAVSGLRADLISRPKQVIAFSDASDLLTYPVPPIKDQHGKDVALVVNVYDRNEIRWFGLVANPIKAHTGHAANNAVLKLMLQQ